MGVAVVAIHKGDLIIISANCSRASSTLLPTYPLTYPSRLMREIVVEVIVEVEVGVGGYVR